MPRVIIVKFENYTGPELIKGHPKCVPIAPVTREWVDGKSVRSRTQFPLRLSWAMTIHKSQGLTLNQAVIDIGEKDITTGSTFVACSRLKTLNGLYFEPKAFSRIESLNQGKRKGLISRIKQEGKLDWKELQ